MQRQKNRKIAFTLIELLITSAIIMLLAVIAIPSYSKYNRTKDLQSKAEETKALLENALTLSKNNEQTPVQYFITITGSEIEMRKDGSTGDNIIKKVTLTSGQSIASSMTCDDCFTDNSSNKTGGNYLIIPYQAYTVVDAPEKRSYCLWQINSNLDAGGACNDIRHTVADKTITVAVIQDAVSSKTATITMNMVGIPLLWDSEYVKEYLPVVVKIAYD